MHPMTCTYFIYLSLSVPPSLCLSPSLSLSLSLSLYRSLSLSLYRDLYMYKYNIYMLYNDMYIYMYIHLYTFIISYIHLPWYQPMVEGCLFISLVLIRCRIARGLLPLLAQHGNVGGLLQLGGARPSVVVFLTSRSFGTEKDISNLLEQQIMLS